MILRGIKFISIGKEKYNIISPEKITKKIDQQKFREFINLHKDVFLWDEETVKGQKTLEIIDTFSVKETIPMQMNQFRAYAFYKKEKGYYGLDVAWVAEWGIILVNFNNSRISVPALEILLDMANYCEAMLLVNGQKQITKEFIDKEKNEIEEKKKK